MKVEGRWRKDDIKDVERLKPIIMYRDNEIRKLKETESTCEGKLEQLRVNESGRAVEKKIKIWSA